MFLCEEGQKKLGSAFPDHWSGQLFLPFRTTSSFGRSKTERKRKEEKDRKQDLFHFVKYVSTRGMIHRSKRGDEYERIGIRDIPVK